jgi:sugar phosphate isomerase/epimerase
MGSFKYAITLASFRNIESIEQTLNRISKLGFDAVEMYGEPEKVDVKDLVELFDSYRSAVCGVTGMWGSISEDGWKRKLMSLDAGVQEHAKTYVKQCIQLCQSLGGTELNICLFADDNLSIYDKTHRAIPKERKAALHDLAVPILSELSKFAANYGVRLLLEPLNRYSTPYCNTAHDAMAIANKVNQENFGVLLDTFHMNIEEDSFRDAILGSKRRLRHMHFADNNRKLPGYAHIDFREIVASLINIEYDGYISFEPTISDVDYETQVKDGLQLVKSHEKALLQAS